MTDEQQKIRQQRAKKRREQAQEKREKDKRETLQRLLKKQDTKKGIKVLLKHMSSALKYFEKFSGIVVCMLA